MPSHSRDVSADVWFPGIAGRIEARTGEEWASYGDAFLAALGVGDVRKSDILTWNPEERRIVPDRGNRAAYQRQYRIFRQLYDRNRDLMAELS